MEHQLDVVLTLDMFKQQWSAVPIAGAFQTRLKEMPSRELVVHHLESQGSTVYSPLATDVLTKSLQDSILSFVVIRPRKPVRI